MNNFRIPPSPAWFTPAVCTPNNGLLYIAGNCTSLAHIPSIEQRKVENSDAINVQIIQTQNRFKSIACDLNWSTTKWFVTLNEHNIVWVWDVDTEKICRGHKAHVSAASSNNTDNHNQQRIADASLGGAMCITKDRQVLSIDRNAFVKYCLASNTYSTFNENFIVKRGTVCMIKASPYNENMISVGYRNGLIVIANIADSTVLQKLRAHDTDIVSMEWMLVPTVKTEKPLAIEKSEHCDNTPIEQAPKVKCEQPSSVKKSEKRSQQKHTRREAPKPIVDAGDMFDIHSYDYLEEEFGTISKPIKASLPPPKEETKSNASNANFDFAEACQSLRDQIRAVKQSESDDSDLDNAVCTKNAVNMSDIQEMTKKNGKVADGSIGLSDDSHEIDVANNSALNELEDVINALNINEQNENAPSGKVHLATGAHESFVVVWNVENGEIVDKIQLKSQQGKLPIPKPVCAVSWFRSNEMLVNSPSGKISLWKIDIKDDSSNLKFFEDSQSFTDSAVIGVCSNSEHDATVPIVWSFSMHLNVVARRFLDDGNTEIVAKFATLPIGMYTIRESPHDPNKIAIAGNNKRISILDLTTLQPNNIQIQSLTSKIQGKVLAVAWNPSNENLLSFSTNEGRVGTFNLNKIPNPPDLIKNFNGKDVYRISYGTESESMKSTLFACNDHKLMMFNENSVKFDGHKSIEFPAGVSSVVVNKNYIAVGLSNGVLKVLSNDQNKKEIYSESLSKKYLSDMAWSSLDERKLAVSSSDDKIYILNASTSTDASTIGFEKFGELVGHQSGVTWVHWSNQSEHKLVSASFDSTVRVWNTESLECIAWFESENRMYCAIFSPNDENFVLCSGQAETLQMFDTRKCLVSEIGSYDAKKKKKSTFNANVQWAAHQQNDVAKLRSQEKKKLRKLEKKNRSNEEVDEIADNLNAVSLSTAPIKLNYTTFLYLTSKELNKDPLTCLEQYLCREKAENGKSNEFLHEKLFGDRENVQQLLQNELKNHKFSKTESIGNILIPQINFELKSDILQSITEKRLTTQQISLAPTISYDFWKNCCLAYVNQCIEQGTILQAIPYLMAVHQVTDAIEKLCDGHFYREAFCIAKMYKEAEDTNVFETIVTKWIKHLEQMGNLDGAAFISMLTKKPQTAIDLLVKRKSKTPQIEQIINLIQQQMEAK